MKKNYFSILIFIGLFVSAPPTNALTFTINCYTPTCTIDSAVWVNGSLQAALYAPGAPVTMSGSVTSDDNPHPFSCLEAQGFINSGALGPNGVPGCMPSVDPPTGIFFSGVPVGTPNTAPATTGTWTLRGGETHNYYNGASRTGTLTVNSSSVNLQIHFLDRVQKLADKLIPLFKTERAFAQTSAVATTAPNVRSILVANVNLTDAQLIRVSDNDYTITFTLTNKGELQQDVVYSTILTNSRDEEKRIYLSPSRLTNLEKDKPVFVNEKFLPPLGLSGTYNVYVSAVTATGLPLGLGKAGVITLEDKDFPSLSSCSVNAKEYQTNETLPVTCAISSQKPIASYAKNEGGLMVVSKAYRGLEPLAKASAPGDISGGRSTQTLKGLSVPGTYIIRTQLATRNGAPVGEVITNTFVIKGISAQIMNLMLDKSVYEKGETAKGTIAASLFKTDPAKLFKIQATLTGRSGTCAKDINQEFYGKSAVELLFPVDKKCVDPAFKVTVTDERGNVLAEKTLGLTTERKPLGTNAKVALGVIGLLVIVYFIRHEKFLQFVKKHAKRKK